MKAPGKKQLLFTPSFFDDHPACVLFGVFLLLFILMWLRRPDALLNSQFWAEDGEFFTGQLTLGTFHTLFLSHVGYLVLVPRLVAAFAALFPASWIPFVYNSAALTFSSLSCAVFVLPPFRPLLQSDVLRFALCLLFSTAIYSDELVGNLTNVQWFLILPLLLIIFLASRHDVRMSSPTLYLTSLATALIVLSCPLAILALPLLLWEIVRRKSKDWLVLCTAILSELIQLTVMFNTGTHGQFPGLNVLDFQTHLLSAFAYRVIFSSLLGKRALEIALHFHYGIVLFTLLASTVWITWLWLRSDTARRRIILWCLYLTFGSMVLAALGRGVSMLQPTELRGERYFFLAGCLFAYLIALTINHLGLRSSFAQGMVMVGLFSVGIFGNFAIPTFVDLHWTRYAPLIDSWRHNRHLGTPTAQVVVPINPAPWTLVLPGPRRWRSPLAPPIQWASLDAYVSPTETHVAAGRLPEGHTFGQTFTCRKDGLSRIDILVATYTAAIPSGALTFHLRSKVDATNDIASVTIKLTSVIDNNYVTFGFAPIHDSAGKRYYFFLDDHDVPSGYAITVWRSAQDVYTGGDFYIDGHPQPYDVSFRAYCSGP